MSKIADLTKQVEDLTGQLENSRSSQAGSDKSVAKLKAENKLLHEQIEFAGKRPSLSGRLDRIEKSYTDKARALELGFYARTRCLQMDVEFELLSEISFNDESEIDLKIEKVVGILGDRKEANIKTQLSNSPKPGSGDAPKGRDPGTEGLSAEEMGIYNTISARAVNNQW